MAVIAIPLLSFAPARFPNRHLYTSYDNSSYTAISDIPPHETRPSQHTISPLSHSAASVPTRPDFLSLPGQTNDLPNPRKYNNSDSHEYVFAALRSVYNVRCMDRWDILVLHRYIGQPRWQRGQGRWERGCAFGESDVGKVLGLGFGSNVNLNEVMAFILAWRYGG